MIWNKNSLKLIPKLKELEKNVNHVLPRITWQNHSIFTGERQRIFAQKSRKKLEESTFWVRQNNSKSL